MSDSHDAVFYVQIEPDFYQSYAGKEPRLNTIKAVKLTQKRPKPEQQVPGTVLTKLTIRVPDAAFLPLRPEVIIVIPEDMVIAKPIEVIAEDPDA